MPATLYFILDIALLTPYLIALFLTRNFVKPSVNEGTVYGTQYKMGRITSDLAGSSQEMDTTTVTLHSWFTVNTNTGQGTWSALAIQRTLVATKGM